MERLSEAQLKPAMIVSSLIAPVTIYQICLRADAHVVGKTPISTGLFLAGLSLMFVAWCWYRVLVRYGLWHPSPRS